jgi:phosphatidylserine decarboxylase
MRGGVVRSAAHAFCEAPLWCLVLFALAILSVVFAHLLLAILPALLLVFVLFFFRDPLRLTPEDPDALYASADGTVVFAGEAEHELIPGGRGRRVLIFMSPLNVHRNKAPLRARVREVRSTKGKFLPAFREGMELVNERASVVFENKGDIVVVTQIAGVLARRIVCRACEQSEYRQGEEFGLIRFGSANEVLFGTDWDILVQKGDRVKAGLSVIARRKA